MMNMMPLKLTLSAFGPYPDCVTVDFQQFQENGLFLITGPTGSGKTMIFDAIVFALFGKSSGQMRDSDSLRCDHALINTPTFVEYTFLLHHQTYLIKRTPKYYLEGRKTPKMPTALLTLPDGKIIEGVREVDAKVVALLGVDDKQFKQIAMIAQGEFTKLIMSSSEEREKVLRELFHTQCYQRLEEKLKAQLKVYKDKYDILFQRKQQIIDDLNIDTQDYKEYLKETENDLSKKEQQFFQLETAYEKQNQKIQLYNIQNQRILQLDNYIEQAQELQNQEQDYKKLKQTIEQLKKAKETNYLYRTLIQETKKLQSLQKQSHEVEKQIQQHDSLFQKSLKQYQQIHQLSKQKETLQKQNHELKQMIDDLYRYQHDYEEKQSYLQKYHIMQEEYKLLLQKKDKLEKNIQKDLDTIHSEEQLKTEFELAQQKFKLANDRKIKIHELSQLHDQLLKEIDNRVDYQEVYQLLEKQLYDEKKAYDKMEQLFYRKQAGMMAMHLKEGDPCPVCGSIHHPDLARIEDDHISQESVDKQKSKVNRIQERFQDNRQQLLLKNQLIETIKKQIEKASHELQIDEELTKEVFIRELNKTHLQEREIKKSYSTMEDELKYIQKLKKSIALSQKDMVVYEDEKIKKEKVLEEINNYIQKINGRLDNSLAKYDVEDIKIQLKEGKSQLEQLNQQIEYIQKEYNQSQKEHVQLETQKTALLHQIEKQHKELESIDQQYHEQLQQYEDEALFLSLKEQIGRLEQYEKQYQDYMIARQSLQQQIASLKEEVKDLSYIDLKELQNHLQELSKQINSLKEVIDQDKLSYALKKKQILEIEKINDTLKDNEKVYQQYMDLSYVTSGKNESRVSLERYVLAAYFEKMLLYANDMMKELTQGRYRLVRKDYASKGSSKQGLELDVFDYESGVSRDIKTLSGGESFKAALSLALGLSYMIQDHAGGIELNTLFIDEGFGSLDSQSLDQALNCLLELHQDNKLIGIISHVSELKDRIDSQIVITRERKTSQITIK